MKGRGSLNHLYRLVWSQVLGAWVAVAETTKGRGKGASRKLLVAVVGLSSALAQAAPEGGQVVSGTGSIAQSGATTTITQATQNLSLNWDSFNIAAQETVSFNQPSATAIAVNRIMDSNGTQILGNLNANGQVYLINPNGILFGQGAQVNVGALVASTLDLNDASLNGDSRSFSGNGAGSVINRGTLNAADGGYVALLGNTVSNQGTITAPRGSVALGAGSAATLTFADNSLVQMQVDQSLLNNLADNGGLIQANGGRVLMSAGAKDALLASVVNNTGVIEARTVENHDGVIVLLGGMQAGTVQVAGTLDASAPNGGDGGFIETSAAHVNVADNAKITTAAAHGKTGTWLIDPTDYTVAATDPGNGSSYMSNTALSTSLNTNNVTIQTLADGAGNGDIHVNGVVSWSANNTLTLDAHRNININQSITATGDSGKLALKYGQGATDGVIGGVAAVYNVNAPVNLKEGDNFSTQLGSTGTVKDYTVITSLGAQGSTTATDLQGMNGNLDGNYVLGSNIDASGTSSWNAGAGFASIGSVGLQFAGSFNGLGHSISNLIINRPLTDYVGLFGNTGTGSVIRNVGLLGGSVSGDYFVGGLVGYTNGGAISNSYATGSVIGNNYLGGLAGYSYASAVGNSYATGSVSGTNFLGGLVGHTNGGAISNSYATGSVSGTLAIGGLVGGHSGATISNSYATGSVNGSSFVGGLVGSNNGTVSNSYWNSSVKATGIGGGTTTGATGLTGAQMMQQASFSSWNTATPNTIANTGGSGAVWRIYEGHTAPLLTSLLTGLTLSGAPDATVTYNGAAQSGGAFTLIANVLGAAATGTNAGFHNGYYSTQQGYDITGGNLSIAQAALTLSANNITKTYDGGLTAAGTATVTSGTLFAGDSFTGGSFTFADKNVGSGNKTVTATGVTVNDGNSGGNYNISYADNTASTINKFNLSVTGLTASDKTYDANTTATLGGTASIAKLGSDDVAVIGSASGTFASKNAGTQGVTVSGNSLTGTDAGNYNLLQQTGLSAAIGKADLSVTGLTAGDKTYNANTTAILGGTAAVAAFSGDDVTLAGVVSGLFADKHVGTGKVVSVTGNSLSGTDAGNYNLLQQTGLSAAIGKADLSVTGLTAGDKTYNANTTAILGGTAAVAAFSGDDVTLAGVVSGLFADKNVGTGKAVSISGNTLSGSDAGNYNLLQQTGLSAAIGKADLSVTGITADSKAYDGNTVVSLNTAAARLNGLLVGDEVTVSAAGVFDSKNVGASKTVALVSRYAGADLGNYRIRDQGSTAADISRATLTYAATPASFFSGRAPGALSGGVSGFVSGETLAGSTRGAPIWTTAAGINSQPGVYAINGDGLTASNYVFAQAAGNASALTLMPGAATEPVVNVTAQLVSSVLSPQASSQPQTLNLSSSIRVSQIANADSGAADDSSAADANNSAALNTQMTIGSAGPSLEIVNGGVKLPDNMVAGK